MTKYQVLPSGKIVEKKTGQQLQGEIRLNSSAGGKDNIVVVATPGAKPKFIRRSQVDESERSLGGNYQDSPRTARKKKMYRLPGKRIAKSQDKGVMLEQVAKVLVRIHNALTTVEEITLPVYVGRVVGKPVQLSQDEISMVHDGIRGARRQVQEFLDTVLVVESEGK